MNIEVIEFGKSHQTMSSLEISRLTGKHHNDVMKAIRAMEPSWQKVSQGKFSLTSRKVAQPNGGERDVPCYELTKTECLYIATKFNDEARARLILRWEELERQQRSSVTQLPNFQNPADAARAWAELYEQRLLEAKRADEAESQVLALTQEIESMQPKVSYYDSILASKSTVLTTQIAQDYGMSAITFNKTLNELAIQRKVNGQWILYAPFLGMGYVQSKPVTITHTDGFQSVKYNTEWTQKGRLFLYEQLKKHNILPLIEQAAQKF